MDKQFFKLMDDYILIRSKGEEKNSKLFIPNTGSYEQRRQWADKDNRVYAIADNLKDKLNKNDKVLLVPHAKLRKIDELTKLMEDKLKIKFTVDIKDKDGKKIIGEEQLEKFFIVKFEDIICIIN